MTSQPTQKRPVALVTGSSGGIGAELAECFADDGIDLILVGRQAATLVEAAAVLSRRGVSVTTIVEDLAIEGGAARLYESVRSTGQRITYLVNNAGVGVFGLFADTRLEQEMAMLRLNVMTPTELCKLFLPDLMATKGRILNVSSLAAFQPGPYMAVYYGSKAYLMRLSEAIAWELREKGVTVTTLCPGPTRTGFAAASGMENSGLVKGKRLGNARAAARAGYRAMRAGRIVHVHGIANRLLAFASSLAPRTWSLATVAAMSAPKED